MSDPMRETPDEMREMTAPAAGASPVAGLIQAVTSPWGERAWLRVYCIAIAMAFFLSLTGAMGTNEAPLSVRLGYWLMTMIGGTVAVQLVSLIMDRFLRLEPLAEAITLFLLSLPAITLTVWGLEALYFGRPLNSGNLQYLMGPVLIVTVAMSGLQYAFARNPRQSHVFAEAVRTEPAKAFRDRLPFKYRQAEIYALSAEDHYLRIYTSAGETLILLRFYDAIRELDGIEGSQTHRSWWVAKDAVSDVVRGDGRIALRIKGDIEAPVSRSYAKTLKASGWF